MLTRAVVLMLPGALGLPEGLLFVLLLVFS